MGKIDINYDSESQYVLLRMQRIINAIALLLKS